MPGLSGFTGTNTYLCVCLPEDVAIHSTAMSQSGIVTCPANAASVISGESYLHETNRIIVPIRRDVYN